MSTTSKMDTTATVRYAPYTSEQPHLVRCLDCSTRATPVVLHRENMRHHDVEAHPGQPHGTVEILCPCAVCQCKKALVPVGMLAHAKMGTKSYRTTVHNLVCIAWSPMGAGASVVRVP